MMGQAGRDWRLILLLVGGGGGGLLVLGVAISVAAYAAFDAWRVPQTAAITTQTGIHVALGALVLVGAILLLAAYQALLAILGRPRPPTTNTPMHFRTACVLLLVWLAASILAQAVLHAGRPAWLASPLHVVAIGSPVYLFARLATGGLSGGTQLRIWGTLATSLLGSTGISALAEITLLLTGASAAAVFLVQNPDYLLAVQDLLHDLNRTSGVENALAVLQPILVHPMALVTVLVTVALITPIVEEVAKSAAPWIIHRRLRTEAQGFWVGAVSGAGFALFEGLMASADTSGDWTAIFLIRAWSSMMHILASGLVGWGIAAFRLKGRSSRLVAGYAFAIALHAAWNAAVVGIGYGGLRSAFSFAGPDPIAVAAMAAGGLTLITLAIFLPAAILLANRMLRRSAASLESHPATPGDPTLASPRLEG